MDISQWPLDKIMQLPDNFFGRRWPIITSRTIGPGSTDQWIIDTPLPERLILWNIFMNGTLIGLGDTWAKFALGDHDPLADVEFDAFERLFPGDYDYSVQEGAFYLGYRTVSTLFLRKPVEVAGRRFAVQAQNGDGANGNQYTFAFVVSSIPKEIPDCLISA